MYVDPRKLSKPERILWSYGITDPREIDLEAVAYGLGALVRYRKLDGCEARMVGDSVKAMITVNSESRPSRRRFSLAHEIAHWSEDRRRGAFLCSKDDIGPQNAEAKTVEALANGFASQLILPSYLFDPRVAGKPVSLDTAEEARGDFKASLSATAIKLVKRSSTPAVVICHSQTAREWYVPNMSFPSDMWVKKEMHQDTAGFELLFGSASGMSRVKQEPASRWFNGNGTFRLSVRSQSVKLPDGTVLSVVAL